MTVNIFKHMTLNIFKHMTLNIFKHMTVNKLTKTVFMTGKNQLNGKVSLFGLKVKIVEINEGPFGYLSQKIGGLQSVRELMYCVRSQRTRG